MFAAAQVTQPEGRSHPDFHQWVNGLTKHGDYACAGILLAMKSSEIRHRLQQRANLKDMILRERSQTWKTTPAGAKQSGGSQHFECAEYP